MAFFRCEMFDKNGKVIEVRNIQISVGSVDLALKDEKIKKLKQKSQNQGFGFRVKREED